MSARPASPSSASQPHDLDRPVRGLRGRRRKSSVSGLEPASINHIEAAVWCFTLDGAGGGARSPNTPTSPPTARLPSHSSSSRTRAHQDQPAPHRRCELVLPGSQPTVSPPATSPPAPLLPSLHVLSANTQTGQHLRPTGICSVLSGTARGHVADCEDVETSLPTRHRRGSTQRVGRRWTSLEAQSRARGLRDGEYGFSPTVVRRKSENPCGIRVSAGALGWNRTSGTRFRKPVLYPLSYEGRDRNGRSRPWTDYAFPRAADSAPLGRHRRDEAGVEKDSAAQRCGQVDFGIDLDPDSGTHSGEAFLPRPRSDLDRVVGLYHID
jgi:hypothetical protein